jgi:hypothetical protein
VCVQPPRRRATATRAGLQETRAEGTFIERGLIGASPRPWLLLISLMSAKTTDRQGPYCKLGPHDRQR